MKPIVAVAVLLYSFALAAEEKTESQPLVNIQNLKNAKSEVVGRLFRLLSSSGTQTTTEQPRDGSTYTFPYIARTFRRLNIFGLQTPPDDPPRNADGTPCSCETKELVPDILHVTKKPADESVPNFFVVNPKRMNTVVSERTSDDLYYPKLNLNELIKPTQVDSYQQPAPFRARQQPTIVEASQLPAPEVNQLNNFPETTPLYFHPNLDLNELVHPTTESFYQQSHDLQEGGFYQQQNAASQKQIEAALKNQQQEAVLNYQQDSLHHQHEASFHPQQSYHQGFQPPYIHQQSLN